MTDLSNLMISREELISKLSPMTFLRLDYIDQRLTLLGLSLDTIQPAMDFLEMMQSDNPTIVAERERLLVLWRIVKGS